MTGPFADVNIGFALLGQRPTWDVHLADSRSVWHGAHPIKLVWTDPPFGTGKVQTQGDNQFADLTPDAAVDLLEGAINNLYPHLTGDAVVCVIADYRIVHDVVVRLKRLLTFQGEVIWSFGLGRPRTSWWPNRHNTIVTFTVRDSPPAFDASAVPRTTRLAPKRGYGTDKPAGSVWDKTLSNTDRERVGYPNQKPLAIIEPFILAHTVPGDFVADPFVGSGSTGFAAVRHGRNFIGQDVNPEAIAVTTERLRGCHRLTRPLGWLPPIGVPAAAPPLNEPGSLF